MNPLTMQIDIGGIWRLGLFWGLALCILGLAAKARKVGIFAAILWAYVAGRALYLLEYPALPFGIYNTAFQATAGQALAELILIPLAAIFSPKWIWRIVWIVVAIEIGSVWGLYQGIMSWPSLSTAFIALCLPWLPMWLAVAGVITILAHHGSTALVIFAVQMIVEATRWKSRHWLLILFLNALAITAYIHSSGPLLDGSERLAAYRRFMDLWSSDINLILFGSGPGTFMWVSLIFDKFKGDLFLQLHSDWLQITFELGMLGVLLSVGVLGECSVKAWRSPKLLSGVLGAGAFMLTYHPLRFFPSAFVIALIVQECCVEFSRTNSAADR